MLPRHSKTPQPHLHLIVTKAMTRLVTVQLIHKTANTAEDAKQVRHVEINTAAPTHFYAPSPNTKRRKHEHNRHFVASQAFSCWWFLQNIRV
jgi:hypothetical protein